VASKIGALTSSLLSGSCELAEDFDANFMTIGLDSLAMTEISSKLRDMFGVNVPSTIAFSHGSVNALTGHVCTMLAEIDKVRLPASSHQTGQPATSPTTTTTSSANEKIDVVGMSCRFAGGVVGVESFWTYVAAGKMASENVPFDRWDSDAFLEQFDMTEKQKACASQGAFVTDIEHFDPSFFGISQAEACAIPPQERALFECAFLAFRDAGFTKLADIKGLKCGLFVGMKPTEAMTSMTTGQNMVQTDSDKLLIPSVYDVLTGGNSAAPWVASPSFWASRAPAALMIRPAPPPWWPSTQQPRRCGWGSATWPW
jgi:acyl carrier protein